MPEWEVRENREGKEGVGSVCHCQGEVVCWVHYQHNDDAYMYHG